MSKLASCPHCQSFLPKGAALCPHCDRPASVVPLPMKLAMVGGAALLSMTLSACYGSAIVSNPFCAQPSRDLDNDGYCLNFDCNESDPSIHAMAPDPAGDGIDQNCDGVDGNAGDAGTRDGG